MCKANWAIPEIPAAPSGHGGGFRAKMMEKPDQNWNSCVIWMCRFEAFDFLLQQWCYAITSNRIPAGLGSIHTTIPRKRTIGYCWWHFVMWLTSGASG